MTIKVLGVFTLLLGLVLIVCMVMTWREMRSAMLWREQMSTLTLREQMIAMKSELAPTPASMPLTRFVCPEFFDTRFAGPKPAKRAQAASNRIYIIGGGSFALEIAGITLLVLPSRRKSLSSTALVAAL
ncbi:MAG: hypothetical protein ACKO3V_06885 [Pirellula sp.]